MVHHIVMWKFKPEVEDRRQRQMCIRDSDGREPEKPGRQSAGTVDG